MAEKPEEKKVKNSAPEKSEEFRVEDRRHWARVDGKEEETAGEVTELRQPTLLDEYRQRAEAAEKKLQEYIEAFKNFKEEQEQFRLRLSRDIDRRVELSFGGLVGELLESMDDLDLAMEHVNSVPEAEPLAKGVEMARKRFLGILERNGVLQVSPEGSLFDPNEAEAVRVDNVVSPDDDGKVTQTLRAGYRLGERVIRAARVAVGRFSAS